MENKCSEPPKFKPNPDLKLMDQVREVLRYHHYAYRTEQAYCQWIVRYIKFFGSTIHPRELGAKDVERFLSHLVVKENVSAGTQRQALNAVIFLYRHVLQEPIENELAPVKSKRQRRPPTVLSQTEVMRLLDKMDGKHLLMAKLLYGCGLRLMECLRLRVQDVDLDRGLILIRGGKGGKDRTTVLPNSIAKELELQLTIVQSHHQMDLEEGFGSVYVPEALSRKYPNAHKEFAWQWVFPAKKRSIDPRSGREMRHHVLESGLQKAVKIASKAAGITKRVGCHTLRHSFATHMLENGTNIRVLQDLMGHADVKTTEIYTHVMSRDIQQLESPLDRLS